MWLEQSDGSREKQERQLKGRVHGARGLGGLTLEVTAGLTGALSHCWVHSRLRWDGENMIQVR